jgi:hypothetical protein
MAVAFPGRASTLRSGRDAQFTTCFHFLVSMSSFCPAPRLHGHRGMRHHRSGRQNKLRQMKDDGTPADSRVRSATAQPVAITGELQARPGVVCRRTMLENAELHHVGCRVQGLEDAMSRGRAPTSKSSLRLYVCFFVFALLKIEYHPTSFSLCRSDAGATPCQAALSPSPPPFCR